MQMVTKMENCNSKFSKDHRYLVNFYVIDPRHSVPTQPFDITVSEISPSGDYIKDNWRGWFHKNSLTIQ